MASLPQSHLGNLTNENRIYSHLREMLPTTDENGRFSPYYVLHNEEWRYFADLDDVSLSIIVFSSNGFADRFSVRVGILRETGENIVTKDLTALTKVYFEDFEVILKSQLDWILKSNEHFIFFVEIEKKDEERLRREKKKTEEEKAKYKKLKFCK